HRRAMNRPPPRVHSDFQTLLDALSVRQYLAPHEPTGRSLPRVIETLGVCPQAVGQAIDWLHLDPMQAIGRVRRTALMQLACAILRFWLEQMPVQAPEPARRQ